MSGRGTLAGSETPEDTFCCVVAHMYFLCCHIYGWLQADNSLSSILFWYLEKSLYYTLKNVSSFGGQNL